MNKAMKFLGTIALARGALHLLSGGQFTNLLSPGAWTPGAAMNDFSRLLSGTPTTASDKAAVEVRLTQRAFDIPQNWTNAGANTYFLQGMNRR